MITSLSLGPAPSRPRSLLRTQGAWQGMAWHLHWCGLVRHRMGMARHGTERHSNSSQVAQHGMAWHVTAWHSMEVPEHPNPWHGQGQPSPRSHAQQVGNAGQLAAHRRPPLLDPPAWPWEQRCSGSAQVHALRALQSKQTASLAEAASRRATQNSLLRIRPDVHQGAAGLQELQAV